MIRKLTTKEFNDFFNFFDDGKSAQNHTYPIFASKFDDIYTLSVNGFEELSNLKFEIKDKTWLYITIYFGYRGYIGILKYYLIDNIFLSPFGRTKIKDFITFYKNKGLSFEYTGHIKGQVLYGSYFSKILSNHLESTDFYA